MQFLKLTWLRATFRQMQMKYRKQRHTDKSMRFAKPDDADNLQIDGQVDLGPLSMPRRRRLGGDVCAIFVHAGAGYHSIQNERTHLEACEDAAKCAMTYLKNGGDAVDAVEIAIKVLENKEITNAGWGSNLTLGGTVECDATIVDHYGRSGAVGALGQIRNPIHLARIVLEQSTRVLSLKRVPPNLVVGSGAVDLAFEHNVPVVPNDDMVSENAKSRWVKWREDLEKFDSDADPTTIDTTPLREEAFASCWNESQPYSPRLHAAELSEPSRLSKQDHKEVMRSSTAARGALVGNDEQFNSVNESKQHSRDDEDGSFIDDNPELSKPTQSTSLNHNNDMITDTVGAIAIDCLGNIAAGSSSGGIGMKHSGRVGPAALVNVGTAVIPIDASDLKKTSVASVTSGTGEHMATTSAASTCASRIYSSIRRTKNGELEAVDDDGAIKTFVERDFMGHPSVLHSHSPGAIGVLAAKKTVDGIWLYFAHNTDSFAVASMSSDDRSPRSLMSRNKGDSKVITGGRAIKHWPVCPWGPADPPDWHNTWPQNPDEALNPPAYVTSKSRRQRMRRIATTRASRTYPKTPYPGAANL